MSTENIQQTLLLTPEQQQAVIQYFENNPTKTKLSRKDSPIKYSDKDITIPYSIMKIKNNYYALYRAYRKSSPSKEKDSYGKEKLYFGEGEAAIVKGGQNIVTGENVAIKISKKLNSTEFNIEVQAQKQVNRYKGSIIREDKNKGYLAMPIILGINLDNLITNNYLADKSEVTLLTILNNILQATEAMHTSNVLHLDLGPQNIKLDPDNNNQITIMDFGQSKTLDPKKKSAESFTKEISINKQHYCPIELREDARKLNIDTITNNRRYFKQQVTPKADIYSLGFLFKNYFQELFSQNPEVYKLFNQLTSSMLSENPVLRPEIKECMEQINLCLLLIYLNKSDLENGRKLCAILPKKIIKKAKSLFQLEWPLEPTAQLLMKRPSSTARPNRSTRLEIPQISTNTAKQTQQPSNLSKLTDLPPIPPNKRQRF